MARMTRSLASRRGEQEPFREVLGLRNTINDLFEDFFTGQPFFGTSLFERGRPEGGAWAPPVDILDKENEVVVYAGIPGCAKGDCNLEVKDNTLVLSGKCREFAGEEESCVRRELPSGEFHRAFSLPSEVDSGQLKASYKDGILEIRMPKSEAAKPHKVPIE